MNTKTETPIDNSAFGPPQGAVERAVIHAGDIMTTDVLWVGSDTTVREIATLLSEKNISAVPVVEHGEMLGMVSEADLIQR